ncbi:hypothetical protein [Clostridium sp. YIM B02555]|uniref:hypothetical protein n=1 Tax=Clostridium sp. YIM B02555 TaxID=2911968 RepID=UPI001EEDD23F|nr:hypothetical protein [Clostridium sp. YIM B02555]
MIQSTYTNKEWEDKENEYLLKINSIVIPLKATPIEVMGIVSRLDNLHTEASFDYSNFKRKLELANMDLRNAEIEYFSIIKHQQQNLGYKVTENDIKGLVKSYISNNIINGYSSDLYTLVKYYIFRTTFMDQVLKSILEKKQSINIIKTMIETYNNKNN